MRACHHNSLLPPRPAHRYTHIHTHIHTHTHTHTHTYMQAHRHTQTHRHTDTDTQTQTHRHTDTHTHTHTHTHTPSACGTRARMMNPSWPGRRSAFGSFCRCCIFILDCRAALMRSDSTLRSTSAPRCTRRRMPERPRKGACGNEAMKGGG